MNNKKRKKIIRFSVIGLVLLVVILAVAKKRGVVGERPAIRVTTEKVQKRTIVETVSANGKIQPETEVKISPYISGEVVELYVKEGDDVDSGALLAKIDPEIYISNFERSEANLQMQKANLANARARLEQAKAQFINAEESFKRSKKLYDQNVISDSEFDSAKSSFEVAKAEVEAAKESVKAAEFTVSSARASLKEARENLTRTSIWAPTSGTVSKLNIEVGERVTGASQFSSGTEIMRIANLKRMEVHVEVNENDIVRVDLGDTCIIEVDAYLGEKFKGLVTEIATSANTTGVSADQVTNFDVKIHIMRTSYADLISEKDNIESPFRPGMSATVEIQTETAIDVLSVPIQAVTTRADTARDAKDGSEQDIAETLASETSEYVFIHNEGVASLTKVKTGVQDSRYIQILEGLSNEEEVITGPYRAVSESLTDGDDVNKVERKELFSDQD